MKKNPSEIYSQRYETFRHLDKLRWQMLQLLIAVSTGTALVVRSTSGEIEWWFFALVGFSLIVISFVMFRIGEAIRGNSIVLKSAAEEVGDTGIPDISNKWKSVAHWLSLAVLLMGILLIFMAFSVF